MSIKFKCSQCFQLMQAPDGAEGKQVQCPKCSAKLIVPGMPSVSGQADGSQTSGIFDDVFDQPGAAPGAPGGSYSAPPQYPPAPQPQASNPYSASNPYTSGPGTSFGAGPLPGSRQQALDKVAAPALILMIFAIIGIVIYVISTALQVISIANAPVNAGNMEGNLLVTAITFPIYLCAQGIIVYGCVSMKKLESHAWALTANILALIPCFCSPCGILGIPFGIWGLIVLNDPVVLNALRSRS